MAVVGESVKAFRAAEAFAATVTDDPAAAEALAYQFLKRYLSTDDYARTLFDHAPTDFEWLCRCGADTPSRHAWARHVAEQLTT